jgi:hypothetical protein
MQDVMVQDRPVSAPTDTNCTWNILPQLKYWNTFVTYTGAILHESRTKSDDVQEGNKGSLKNSSSLKIIAENYR